MELAKAIGYKSKIVLLEDPPASTAGQVVSLSKPNILVEFDAIALLPVQEISSQ